jgi:uncharacterized SAM-dependent methyltransferase
MDQIVTVGGQGIAFSEAERIHVEYSHKFSIAEFQDLARRAGFKADAVWTDADRLFSVHYLTVA